MPIQARLVSNASRKLMMCALRLKTPRSRASITSTMKANPIHSIQFVIEPYDIMRRMNQILEIDPLNLRAIVQPGVVNADISAAVAPFGLYYVPDPSSQKACTIGGNVAENSGGPHCLAYGVTTNHTLGLEVVLPEGRVIETDVNAPGYDLTGLLVGSEGT